MFRATGDPFAVEREGMARARRPLAVCLIALAFAVGDGSPASGHELSVDHRASALCIVDQLGNAGIQSYVANMQAFPTPYPISIGGGGFFSSGTNYRPSNTPSWIFYSVRAYWQTATGWAFRDGSWIAAVDQLGAATHPALTYVQTSTGWKNASVNLLYPGMEESRPDASLITPLGRGSYYIYGHFYWSAVFDGAGNVVVNAVDHWEPFGWLTCA
jgi:hypothetical protein